MGIADKRRALLAERRGGVSLPRAFCVDPAMHEFDRQAHIERYGIQAGLVFRAAERYVR